MSDEVKVEVQDLQPGELVLSLTGDYKSLPAGEQLYAHISKVGTVDTLNFEKTEQVKKLTVSFEVDEPEGKGQTYTKWYTPSLNPKSTLSKVLMAVYGEIPASFDPTDLVGKPVRIMLKDYEREGVTRQTVEAVFKPAKDQTVPAIEDFDMDKALDKAGV